MTALELLPIGLDLGAVLALAAPAGWLIARVIDGEAPGPLRVLAPVERALYRAGGVDPAQGMSWARYARAMLALNGLGIVLLYLLQRLQGILPLHGPGIGAVDPALAFNTSVSFVTNTNWQSYVPEQTLGPLVQAAGLGVQNFLSAATGLAVLAAVMRGFRGAKGMTGRPTVGNFWSDLVRITLYILLPGACLLALALASQGVPMTLRSRVEAVWLDASAPSGPDSGDARTIPLGPAASQVAIKQLGTNGGGYYAANSAHPLENPTPLSNGLEIVSLLLLPAAAPFAFGFMLRDMRQGAALLAAMGVLFLPPLLLMVQAESAGNPRLAAIGAAPDAGNMEGKEVRFGAAQSALFAAATTGTSCGAVNAMHDSLTPAGGLAALWLMMLGEVAPGGAGSGLYGLLAFVLVAVFVAGLMVGRTPEYLGAKIDAFEIKMAALVVLVPVVPILAGTAAALLAPAGTAAILNPGPHGFTEVLYAFTSATNNNGSAFAGLATGTLFYHLLLAGCMFAGRFGCALPMLAIAGSLAGKRRAAAGAGTLPTHTPLFVALLAAVIVIVGALTFLPALALGPIAEALGGGS